MFSLNEIVSLIHNMKENHVCIYGCGCNGKYAIDILDKAGIEIVAVCDAKKGIHIDNYKAISIEELEKYDSKIVCIVTPAKGVEDVYERLGKHFDCVINIDILQWMSRYSYCIPKDDVWGYECYVPLNHYESPYISANSVEYEFFSQLRQEKPLDVEINCAKQVALLKKLSQFYYDFYRDLNESYMRYSPNNGWFDEGDATLLYCMIRKYMPKHIIEIGSGYSTAIMLDVKEKYLDNNTEIICIEPYPDRLLQNLKNESEVKIYKEYVQKIDLSIFDNLEAGDILFIDSSHVAKLGGDILMEYFEILPRLKKGVLIHIHDIFYPFIYPDKWIKQGRCYNEAFVLRALLMNSTKYEIMFWNDMMYKLYYEKCKKICKNPGGSSIWLQKR